MEPTAAHGQEATTEREAQSRFEEGLARVRASNFEGARVSFLQAYAVLQKPYILWNLALAEEKTGSMLSALGHFKQFARVGPVGDDRSVAERHIADLMGQTGHLDVVAPTGAQVMLDGAPAGLAPLGDTLDVLPGRHHLEVQTAQGSREAVPDVGAGQFLRVNLMSAAGSSSPTTIQLAPAPVHEANPPGSQPADDHAQTAARAPEASGSSKARVITVALMGAASAALVGVGAYFALQSQNEANTVDRYRSSYGPSWCFQSTSDPCGPWNDAVQAQSRDATASNVLYVAGGVLAAGALATWFLWPKATTSAAVGPSLAVSASGTALYATGHF
jgi:hypothetical protein